MSWSQLAVRILLAWIALSVVAAVVLSVWMRSARELQRQLDRRWTILGKLLPDDEPERRSAGEGPAAAPSKAELVTVPPGASEGARSERPRLMN